MATKNVNIDIVAKDKTRQAMQSATKGVDGVKNSVLNLKNALIGLGAGVAIKSFIDVGKQVESLRIRLKFLFGSVEEGSKAFDSMAKFASKVPFSLEQIQAGAGSLAVVSKDAEELSKMMEITGNVASVTGLDFRTASEQIQRSFSAGIASADLFRERGVRDLLGFKAGATVTAQETAEAFERVFGKNGTMAGATSDLANTLEGRLSMIGDKFFNFQKIVAESFFVGLKQEFGALDKALQDNQDTIDEIADAIGVGLSKAVIATGEAVRFLADNFEIIKRIGMVLIIGKISIGFFKLAQNIALATTNLRRFTKVTKTTVVGILIGLAIAFNDMNDAVAGGIEPNRKLNKLLERRKLIEFAISKLKGKDLVRYQNELKLIDAQIEKEKKLIKVIQDQNVGKDRQIFLTAKRTKFLIKEMQAIEEAKKKQEELNKKFRTGDEISPATQLDRSMTGSELIDPINPLRDLLNNEFQIQKEFEEKNKQRIMENDELQVELARIKADKLLQIAHETAEKEKQIRKEVFDKNLSLIKEGKANEINLEKMTGKEMNAMAKETGREALREMAQHNRTAFALNKAFAIKDAIISTAQGVSKALAMGPLGIPLAIAIGALGVAQVATIASTKYTGRRLGGRMNQGEPYMVGEAGPEMVVPDRPSNVIPNNKLGGSQPVTVNFNINTVDARGFNELLVNSRGTIVNLINSAMNEKGKMAVV